ncbi:MAG: hypothetical protein KJ709_04420 [Nanoarchaeota archaeon]|nr:hypothetical protein [Nanoarchaeota archaeon]
MKNIKQDLEKLEEVSFEIEKEAFRPKILHCSNCNVKMKQKEMEIQVGKDISIRLRGFECPKCSKRYFGLEEAKKLDKAMIMSRLLNDSFKMTRKLSYDGDNYTFRIPKEFTNDVTKKKIEIVPLGNRNFCAYVN